VTEENTTRTRTPRAANTKPRLWIVTDAEGKHSYVRAIDVRVAKDEDSYGIIDGKIPPYAAPAR